MRIELDLPDWCDERHIYIMAGIELAAYKEYGTDVWRVKDIRCNLCGKCCQNLPADQDTIQRDENGTCIHLKQVGTEWHCDLGSGRPFNCSYSDPILTNALNQNECCIQYK